MCMCKHTHLFYSIFVFSIIYLNELSCCNLKVTGSISPTHYRLALAHAFLHSGVDAAKQSQYMHFGVSFFIRKENYNVYTVVFQYGDASGKAAQSVS